MLPVGASWNPITLGFTSVCDDTCGSPAIADKSSIIGLVILYTFPTLDDAPLHNASSRGGVTHAFGCGTIRRYGSGAFQPCGYAFLASSSETEPAMITSSPDRQLTGVATLCFAISCRESSTRNTSSKFRPVVIG